MCVCQVFTALGAVEKAAWGKPALRPHSSASQQPPSNRNATPDRACPELPVADFISRGCVPESCGSCVDLRRHAQNYVKQSVATSLGTASMSWRHPHPVPGCSYEHAAAKGLAGRQNSHSGSKHAPHPAEQTCRKKHSAESWQCWGDLQDASFSQTLPSTDKKP